MKDRAVRYLVYLLILTFPIGLLLRLKISPNIFVSHQDLIVLAIFSLTIFPNIKKYKFVLGNKFLFFQVLFLGAGVVSLIYNQLIHNDINLLFSFMYVLRYIMYLNLFTTMPFFDHDKKLKKLVVLSIVCLVIVGIIQFYFFNDLRGGSALGWDNHLYRLFSTFMDPNYSGILYVIVLLHLLYELSKVTLRNGYKLLILAFTTTMAVYLTYSRTAIIGLISSVFIFAFLKRKLKLLLIFVGFLLLSLTLLSDTSIEGLNPFRVVSSAERLKSAQDAIGIYWHSPIIGVGFNAYRDAQLRYEIREEIGASKSNADNGTDNSFLFVLATSGIIGILLYILSYVYLLKDLMSEKNKYNMVLICMFGAVFFGSLFLNVLFYTPIITWLFVMTAIRKNLN